jgi:hypothetical protein
LKRPSQKSLPSSLFQREESLGGDYGMEDSTLSPFGKGEGKWILRLFKKLNGYENPYSRIDFSPKRCLPF